MQVLVERVDEFVLMDLSEGSLEYCISQSVLEEYGSQRLLDGVANLYC